MLFSKKKLEIATELKVFVFDVEAYYKKVCKIGNLLIFQNCQGKFKKFIFILKN